MKNSRPVIAVVGSLNMDLVIKTPHLPQPGETVLGKEFFANPGGKGANQAVAAAKLGGRVYMVGKIGKDSFGDQLKSNLEETGVDTSHLLREEKYSTGVAFITVDERGANEIIVVPGANGSLSPGDIALHQEAISQSHILLVQLEIPLKTVDCALKLAREKGVITLLDPAPGQKLPSSLLEKVDILSPNEKEAECLTDMKLNGVEDVYPLTHKLLNMGARKVILKMGEKGAIIADGKGIRQIPGVKVEAVDTTAAGDVFLGALAVAYFKEKSIDEAVRYAHYAAALSVTRYGAQSSIPTREEVGKFRGKEEENAG